MDNISDDVPWIWENSVRSSKQLFFSDSLEEVLREQDSKRNTIETFRMAVKCLALDYDGTISPLDVSRSKSRVPKKTLSVLQQISGFIPIVIVTTKDLSFVVPRTPFACAWSAIGGLETRIGQCVRRKQGLEGKFEHVSIALEYAKSHATGNGVEIEEKSDVSKRPLAFCVDWRRARNAKAAVKEIEEVANYCEALGLELVRHRQQPFFDVCPQPFDKGEALKEVLKELRVEDGVLYVGDSATDNTAFEASDVSLGVIHKENSEQILACNYFVTFEKVFSFLSVLLANGLLFDSDFPMIQTNAKKVGGSNA